MPSGRGSHALAVLAAALLWGTTGTVAHYAPAGSSQVVIGASTFGFGGLVLLALDLDGVRRLGRDRSVRGPIGLGVVGVLAYAAMFYLSMRLAGVAIGNAITLGSGPVFAAVLERVVDRRRLGRTAGAAMGLSVVGIALIGVAGAGDASGTNPRLGVLAALAAGFGYALYSWSGARVIARGHPSRSVMAGMFAAASVVLVPAFVVLGPGPLWSGRGLVVLGYLAVIPMALAYLLFGAGLRGLSASVATTLALAEPVAATALATVVLDERLTASAWTGLILIVLGILCIGVAELRGGPG